MERNSIEVAQKLIEDNKRNIESYREDEAEVRKRIEELEKKIESNERALGLLQSSLSREEKYLKDLQEEKFKYLVDNLALMAFIDNGGGLDMLVD